MVAGRNKSLLWASAMSAVLFVIKGVVYWMTGSNLLLGSTLDSFVDSVVSLINYRVQGESFKIPDREHPFGHGGFEVLTSLVQGVLLSSLGLFLIFQSGADLVEGNSAVLNEVSAPLAIAVLSFSAFTGYFIYWFLGRSNNEVRSLSLEADKAHYIGDFFQNILSVIGVIVIWWSDIQWLDGVIGILIGILFIKISIPILRASFSDVSSQQLSEIQNKQIQDIVISSDTKIMGVHRIRTRESGPNKFVDFHMKLPDETPLIEAHDIGEQVVRNLKEKIRNLDVIIHLDPESEDDDDLW
jgi:ferrous-iron efflux pump FieF